MATSMALSTTQMGKPRCTSAFLVSGDFTLPTKPMAKVIQKVKLRVNLEQEYKGNIFNWQPSKHTALGQWDCILQLPGIICPDEIGEAKLILKLGATGSLRLQIFPCSHQMSTYVLGQDLNAPHGSHPDNKLLRSPAHFHSYWHESEVHKDAGFQETNSLLCARSLEQGRRKFSLLLLISSCVQSLGLEIQV